MLSADTTLPKACFFIRAGILTEGTRHYVPAGDPAAVPVPVPAAAAPTAKSAAAQPAVLRRQRTAHRGHTAWAGDVQLL